MHIDTQVIAQAAARATALGLHEGAAAKYIDDFCTGYSQDAAQVRAHVAAITALPEAKTRPAAALKLALSAETIAPDEAGQRLAALPVEIAPRAQFPTLAERAGAMPEIGASPPKLTSKEAKEQHVAALWSKAVARLNEGR